MVSPIPSVFGSFVARTAPVYWSRYKCVRGKRFTGAPCWPDRTGQTPRGSHRWSGDCRIDAGVAPQTNIDSGQGRCGCGDINRGQVEAASGICRRLPGSLAFLASDKLKLTLMNDRAYIEPMAP